MTFARFTVNIHNAQNELPKNVPENRTASTAISDPRSHFILVFRQKGAVHVVAPPKAKLADIGFESLFARIILRPQKHLQDESY